MYYISFFIKRTTRYQTTLLARSLGTNDRAQSCSASRQPSWFLEEEQKVAGSRHLILSEKTFFDDLKSF